MIKIRHEQTGVIGQRYIMNRRTAVAYLLICSWIMFSCNVQETAFQKDLAFLQKYDSVVILSRGEAKVVVSPKYQAKVFTSTEGQGSSFGWINYKAFDAPPDPHMNAFGGENRIWLGPEGGEFSLFFPRGFMMEFANWKIPPAFDTEPWTLEAASDTSALLKKDMNLVNYSGSELIITVERKIELLGKATIEQMLRTSYDEDVNAVGYTTDNRLTNKSNQAWTDSTGMPCIWILDMMPPSANTTVIIPFRKDTVLKPANTNYFGEIPRSRIRYADSVLFFKADGKKRSKWECRPVMPSLLPAAMMPTKEF